MKGMGDAVKTILFGMIFLVGLSFLLSQFYHPERGLLLAQDFPKQETRIVLDNCNTYESCLVFLSNYYTQDQIKQLDLKCENNVCSIRGYLEVGKR
jgi:hypothetical protein